MFHPGEQRAQQLAGFSQVRAAIYDQMPLQHQMFFAQLPYLLLAQRDSQGWPLAHLLMAEPGFIQPLDEHYLAISTHALQRAALLQPLAEGDALAILGIDFATRRRNRASGEVAAIGPEHLVMRIHESFGNCPQYIHQYPWHFPAEQQVEIAQATSLSVEDRQHLSHSQTFFIASGSPSGSMDISHRGGPAGFLRWHDSGLLSFDDFPGNRYMNTLGNLLLDARCALLIPDWQLGTALHLQGEMTIDWAASNAEGKVIRRLWFTPQQVMRLGVGACWQADTAA
ncbi:pyridoxamine 5'-phosphate oxidase family protein [Pantoea phytobeneficialis]|uniref:Pyridoxamine 5'-phosphate oxidase n=1 Tax=Pantoea phytobeneficialis TaxID=2052056 RepID=A0AAP9H4F8_9GAMM|nr:pyridoxamine 5'-phosphate oxidase family protein [Pantoea phytobeneficialis]MDO6406118.1 pyridoxamine 5'-phosphate oxidase family protein [Pantoea phytobeneficialis]QGR06570.1 pyridoxamine 5'-phosphate oxidase [Pantoea phytobeneficialis]